MAVEPPKVPLVWSSESSSLSESPSSSDESEPEPSEESSPLPLLEPEPSEPLPLFEPEPSEPLPLFGPEPLFEPEPESSPDEPEFESPSPSSSSDEPEFALPGPLLELEPPGPEFELSPSSSLSPSLSAVADGLASGVPSSRSSWRTSPPAAVALGPGSLAPPVAASSFDAPPTPTNSATLRIAFTGACIGSLSIMAPTALTAASGAMMLAETAATRPKRLPRAVAGPAAARAANIRWRPSRIAFSEGRWPASGAKSAAAPASNAGSASKVPSLPNILVSSLPRSSHRR